MRASLCPVGSAKPAFAQSLRTHLSQPAMCRTCQRRLTIVGTYPIPETEKEPSTIDVPQVRHGGRELQAFRVLDLQMTECLAPTQMPPCLAESRILYDGVCLVSQLTSIQPREDRLPAGSTLKERKQYKHLQEWVTPKPSKRPDIFPDLEKLETPLPNKLPGDPELPEDEEWEEEQKKLPEPDKKPPEPGEEEEEKEEEEEEEEDGDGDGVDAPAPEE